MVSVLAVYYEESGSIPGYFCCLDCRNLLFFASFPMKLEKNSDKNSWKSCENKCKCMFVISIQYNEFLIPQPFFVEEVDNFNVAFVSDVYSVALVVGSI